jgi:hypothetical protein
MPYPPQTANRRNQPRTPHEVAVATLIRLNKQKEGIDHKIDDQRRLLQELRMARVNEERWRRSAKSMQESYEAMRLKKEDNARLIRHFWEHGVAPAGRDVPPPTTIPQPVRRSRRIRRRPDRLTA